MFKKSLFFPNLFLYIKLITQPIKKYSLKLCSVSNALQRKKQTKSNVSCGHMDDQKAKKGTEGT